MNRAFWIAPLFLIGCSTTTTNTHPYTADLSLMTPYSFELEKSAYAREPYLAQFSHQGKTLIYVAAKHVSAEDSPDLLLHPTLLTIDKVFHDLTVDAVVVEGLRTTGGEIPKNLLTHGEECEKLRYKENCGEPWFTAQTALKKNIPVFSGEPSDTEVVHIIETQGFSSRDLLSFYIIRMIPEWKREGVFKDKAATDLITKRIEIEKKRIGISFDFKFSDFKSWYENHMKKPASFLDIEVDDTAPLTTKDATYVQKISAATNLARDASIVKRIAQVLNLKSNILVVYGSSHLLIQERVLEKMLGSPDFEKIY